MRRRTALGWLLLLPSLGCSAAVVDDESGDTPGPTTQGSVAIERTVTLASSPSAGIRTHVLARFVQVSGRFDRDLAERVVGSPRDLPPVGSCEWRTAPGWEPLPDSAAEGSIELLDVGDVVLRAGPSTLPLAPRAFPDVGDIVSGVVYTSRDDTAELPPGAAYEVETSGSAVADGFRLRVEAPLELRDVRLGAVDVDSTEGVVQLGEPLELAWLPGDRTADRIVVELVPVNADGPAPAGARCVFEDTGNAVVPEPFVTWSAEFDELDVSLHRLRDAPTKVAELDDAEVEFDFGVTARLAVSYPP